jgi:hypothetical protein
MSVKVSLLDLFTASSRSFAQTLAIHGYNEEFTFQEIEKKIHPEDTLAIMALYINKEVENGNAAQSKWVFNVVKSIASTFIRVTDISSDEKRVFSRVQSLELNFDTSALRGDVRTVIEAIKGIYNGNFNIFEFMKISSVGKLLCYKAPSHHYREGNSINIQWANSIKCFVHGFNAEYKLYSKYSEGGSLELTRVKVKPKKALAYADVVLKRAVDFLDGYAFDGSTFSKSSVAESGVVTCQQDNLSSAVNTVLSNFIDKSLILKAGDIVNAINGKMPMILPEPDKAVLSKLFGILLRNDEIYVK